MIALTTTIGHLQEIFKNPGKDTLTREEVYIAANRNLSKVKKNTNWLRNQLHYFRYYGLAKAVYETKFGSDHIVGIQLTEEGKKALMQRTGVAISPSKRVSTPVSQDAQQNIDQPATNGHANSRYTDIAKLIKAIRVENPNDKVGYSVKDEVIFVQSVGK